MEEKIEAQRKALDLSKCTPITLELFKKWKADKEVRRLEEVKTKIAAAEKKSAGSGVGIMSGRDLFTFDPSLFVDDDDAEEEYEIDEEYDPAQHHDDDDDDDDKPNYDPNAISEEDDDEEHKGDDGEDEEDDDGEERKESDKPSAGDKAAAAIDESLFLDDDVPDE